MKRLGKPAGESNGPGAPVTGMRPDGASVQRLVRLPSKERGCDGKMTMSLKEFPHLKAQEMAKKHGKDFGVYRCPYCGKFHLTSKLEKQAEYAPLEYQTNFFEAND